MNGINLYITISAITLGILSAVLNFTGRQKYKDNASFFEAANHELREQNTSLKEDRATLSQELTKAQTESTQKDETIKQLKPFSEIAKIMSNNHKDVMLALSTITEQIATKVKDGKP